MISMMMLPAILASLAKMPIVGSKSTYQNSAASQPDSGGVSIFKHLESTHGGKAEDKNFAEYFEVRILKAYKKPFTMCVEEGTYISSHKGELLNSKSEWHQAKLIRTTTRVVQGGAESLRQQVAGGGRGGGV